MMLREALVEPRQLANARRSNRRPSDPLADYR
jgi:hypothetical protein